jgi:hypothetical protein
MPAYRAAGRNPESALMDLIRRIFSSRQRILVGGSVLAGLLVLSLVVVIATRSPEQPAAADPAPQPTPTVTPADPEPEPDPEPTPLGAAPLTGVPVFEEGILDRPVVGVKVENSVAARPQTGLELADIVYEELIEGGQTRFLALYHSVNPERVGPIRSARPEDAAVFAPHDGFLFASGGRRETVASLSAAGVRWIREDGRVMVRDSSRRAPHNVYAAGESLFGYAAERAPAATPLPWAFSEEPPEGAIDCAEPCDLDPGKLVSVAMSRASTTRFEYESAAGVYRRFQNGEPHLVTGEGRIGADNVVVLGMRVGDGGCCDTAGGRYTATTIVGEGRGVVLRDGRRYEISWSKPSPGAHVSFFGADGRPFALKPGSTWLLLAPASALP